MSLKRIKLFDQFITENYSALLEDEGISKGYNNIKSSQNHGETKGTSTEESEEAPKKKPIFAMKHPKPEAIGTDDVNPLNQQ